MGREIPDFITHCSRSKPFLSKTRESESDWSHIIGKLNSANAWGLNRFSDSNYLERRKAVESHMKKELIKLGAPQLNSPIYFLGRSEEFEKNVLNVGCQIFRRDLPEVSVSFTYGDSLLSFDSEYRSQPGENYENEICG